MTSEKALDMLGMIEFKDTVAHLHTWYKGIDDDMNEAVNMAIKALKAEPCEDAISRQAVLDIINNPLNIRLDEIIKKLPPVNPQPKTGHWMIKRASIHPYGNDVACSVCGLTMGSSFGYKYCPQCGAKMVEPQERGGEE